ncbi:MAG: hypothetical protein ABI433_09965 [Burkholderiaceae bacterium]
MSALALTPLAWQLAHQGHVHAIAAINSPPITWSIATYIGSGAPLQVLGFFAPPLPPAQDQK